MPNLEPIDNEDLDLKSKFSEGVEKEKRATNETKMETPVPSLEKPVETRKEGAVEKEKAYSKILSKVKTIQPTAQNIVIDDAQSASQETTAEAKIQKLVALATEKGVVHAVKVARHLEDNYTLDEFHDRLLANELHDELVKKGLIRDL